MTAANLSDYEFSQFQAFLYKHAGITLANSKKPLVVSRLSKRLREFQFTSFSEYLTFISHTDNQSEFQTAIDLLTTNETYFFREVNHFNVLKQVAEQFKTQGDKTFRVWSAACSSGQEPYSIAMVLDDCLGNRPWQVFASDISTQVLNKAEKGLYPIEQAEQIPKRFLKNYCLKGIAGMSGYLLIDKVLRHKVNFFHGNLNTHLPDIGQFDVIFLRNVMIYFDVNTKRDVVSRIQKHLKPGGYLFIGHSESLNGINDELKMIKPAIFKNV